MRAYRQRELNYDLSQGAHIFSEDFKVKCEKEKCTIEVVGENMNGSLGLEVSASGSAFAEAVDLTIPLNGSVVVLPVAGLTPGSFIKVKVIDGQSGVIKYVNYLFG